MRTITNGQARRIAAEWQAPGNAYSLLQHKGIVSDDLAHEIASDMSTLPRGCATRRELAALMLWAGDHGPGKVDGWGAWDDTPAR